MSIKISFMHFMKWTRVMLPVVFEEFFELVRIFYFFIFCYFFLFKNLGRGGGEGCGPSVPGFYGSEYGHES